MNARELATIKEYKIGDEDRVFFAHRTNRGSEPTTEGTGAGWYWQCRGSCDAFGPFTTRSEASADYEAT